MIVVIADDITGAAELGGIGLRYGLRVMIADDVRKEAAVDLLAVYTNTRSLPNEEAVTIMKTLTEKAKVLAPSLFYKKTDSVLRGHVLSEMKAQMNVLNVTKGLLIPVNPALGRTIKAGQYFVNGELVHETGFSIDPEFPVTSSRIEDMLGKTDVDVKVIKSKTERKGAAVFVGEARTTEDIDAWATDVDEQVLAAGGASFFDALLRKKSGAVAKQKPVALLSPVLFVSGTTYTQNIQRIKALGPIVSFMPDETFFADSVVEEDVEAWAEEIIKIIEEKKKAVIAIGEKEGNADSALLRSKLGEVTKRVLQKTTVHELLIEGGSTAFSVIQSLGWHSFVPDAEYAQGVVRMKVAEKQKVHLTIKPGSYEWPAEWV